MNLKEYSFDRFYRSWSLWLAILQVTMLLANLRLNSYTTWALLSWVFFTVYLFYLSRRLPRLPLLLGYANWITYLRFLIILSLVGFQSFLSNIELFFGFLTAIALDGVDGFLARKFNHSSKQGEYLDMETDAFLVFILSTILFKKGISEWWILIPGGMRYYYRISISLFFNKEKHLLGKKARSTIAVIFFLSLLTAFILPQSISLYLLVVATCLILFSFFSPLVIPVKSYLQGQYKTNHGGK